MSKKARPLRYADAITRERNLNIYEKLINVALGVYDRTLGDITSGAQLYYSPDSMIPKGSAPSWASSSQLTQVIVSGISNNDFCFYKYK